MILLIDNYDPNMREFYKYISEEYSDIHVIRNDQLTCEDILNLSPQAVIIGSGNGAVQDTGICRDILSAIHGRIPVLCIGLGAEVLGECLGITFISRDLPLKKVFNTGFDTSCRLFSGIPAVIPCIGETDRTPEAAFPDNISLAARDEFGRCIAFADNEKNAYGMVFYPNVFGESGKTILRNFISIICDKNE